MNKFKTFVAIGGAVVVPVAFVQIPWCRDPNRCFAQTTVDSAGGVTEMVNTTSGAFTGPATWVNLTTISAGTATATAGVAQGFGTAYPGSATA